MRVSISGAASVGKSTLIKYFLNKWAMYATPEKTYRDIIRENKMEHSSKTSEETQLMILDWMLLELKKYPKDSHVVYDRCPWDNLAYTLQGNMLGKISDEVTAATISLVRESMKDLDIIFWIKHNPQIKIVDDGLRDADESYIKNTDKIFKDLYDHYMEHLEDDIFYPKEDCPAIICVEEVFSTVDDRLMFIGEFLDNQGNLIETENSVLSMDSLESYDSLLKDLEKEKEADENIKKILKNLK